MRFFSKLVVVLLLNVSYFSSINAQNSGPKNLLFRYYEVPLAEKEFFKKEWHANHQSIYQKAIKNNQLNQAYLTEVWHPSGKNAPYQFVSIEVFENIASLDDANFAPLDHHPYLLRKDIMGVNMMMEVNQDTFPLSSMQKGQKIYVDFMKVNTNLPNAFSNYLTLENDIWKPMHQARMKQGSLSSWCITLPWFDSAIEGEFDVIALNGYGSLERFMQASAVQVQNIHPGKDLARDIWQPTNAARDWIEGQWWTILTILK